MPTLDWQTFNSLPGPASTNFEELWRAVIWRHYAQYGEFRAVAQQPGVEFHLRLDKACALGQPGRWFGWQCRWYSIPSGRALGTTRRNRIRDALAKSLQELPGLTDWVLCTRNPLTPSDQAWFFELSQSITLHSWTSSELDAHLHGPGEIFRKTFFGELILTPSTLRSLHEESAASVEHVWCPELHQELQPERDLAPVLASVGAWEVLSGLCELLMDDGERLRKQCSKLSAKDAQDTERLLDAAREWHDAVADTRVRLQTGRLEQLSEEIEKHGAPASHLSILVRGLRAQRLPVAPQASNLLADVHAAYWTLHDLRQALDCGMFALVGGAGYGKTELAIHVTAPTHGRSAGILLHGRELGGTDSLDELARRIVVQGSPVESFMALVAGLDAAGRREGRRLPLVIDGLNEAEDPRKWRGMLARVRRRLSEFPYVLVLCTLRTAYVKDALPDGVMQSMCTGFGRDLNSAVRRYFSYYQMDDADGLLPWGLLDHPLTLKMFCEVTNPTRRKVVGSEAMPTALGELFDRYLAQAANRIAELSPVRAQYGPLDVRDALRAIGTSLWRERRRSIPFRSLRAMLGDDGRVWQDSLVKALEQNGVLTRHRGMTDEDGESAVVYDALAGHLISNALLRDLAETGVEFESWFSEESTTAALRGEIGTAHPLAVDIISGLCQLLPRRLGGRHLWPLLRGDKRVDALCAAARLEIAYVDEATVEQMREVLRGGGKDGQRVLGTLHVLRAASGHPLNASFLDRVLRDMPASDRDLVWTEWTRRRADNLYRDSERIVLRWKERSSRDARDELLALWIMWTLTTTDHALRDQATYALHWFGRGAVRRLFDLAVNSLDINDPYVPERVLAASYGVAMTGRTAAECGEICAALSAIVSVIGDKVLGGAENPGVAHLLIRHYAHGMLELDNALCGRPVTQNTGDARALGAVPWVFDAESRMDDSDLSNADGAILMDFGNYTIGGLIESRGNYDYEHPEYAKVRRQIEARIVQLGFSKDRFGAIDDRIAQEAWRRERRGGGKIDRYGKKYAWIAYYEMYSWRRAQGVLSEFRSANPTPEVDIDPSFPVREKTWRPNLRDMFGKAPREESEWASCGIVPDYDHLLCPANVDGNRGRWVLLDGFLHEESADDIRRVFSFLRGVLVEEHAAADLIAEFQACDYPGNDAIPGWRSEYYTYDGEIPWSSRFGNDLRDPQGRPMPDRQDAFGQWQRPGVGVEVELPVYECKWESYHSELNPARSVVVPAPALCSALELQKGRGDGDLLGRDGKVATLYRECLNWQGAVIGHVTYICADLLTEYLEETGQTLVWLVWGERCLRQRSFSLEGDKPQIHRRARSFCPNRQNPVKRWRRTKRVRDV